MGFTTGYKKINSLLSEWHNGKNYYDYSGVKEEQRDLLSACVNLLRPHMLPVEDQRTYFHGGSRLEANNLRREGFISLTTDREVASSFPENEDDDYRCLYTILVDPEVQRCLIPGSNELETLVIDGCYWEYMGANVVHLYAPNSKLETAKYPPMASLIKLEID